jgi:hypothetical protein
MAHFESNMGDGLMHGIAILGGLLMFIGWGLLLYHIGKRATYWSPANLRVWRYAGWFAVFALVVGVGSVLVRLMLA